MHLSYTLVDTIFGHIFLATSPLGITHLFFTSDALEALDIVRKDFPEAKLSNEQTAMHDLVISAFTDQSLMHTLPLHLIGTPFQKLVWQTLREIPSGERTTYKDIAQRIGKPTAYRAVGTAVGSNRIAVLVPCHRVVPADGSIGNYRWGSAVKANILAFEQSYPV